MNQTIVVNHLSPMLNGKDGLKRLHWAKYRDVRDKWVWLIREQNPQKHSGRVNVHFTRFSTRVADPDNVAAGFKVIGDALTNIGVIQDDSFKVIKKFSIAWEKVSKLKNQRVEIKIEDVA